MTSRDKALSLVKLGVPVFKVRVGSDGTKTPMHVRGHLDATLDPGLVDDWFTESPQAQVGAWMGEAHLLALDVDMKNGKDGWESLSESWLSVPETFTYLTPSGGSHLIYSTDDESLAPSTNYRGMQGVDIRAGSSWVLWNGDVPESRRAFKPAPEWMCDATRVRSSEKFEGTLREWFDSLEPGGASAPVRRALSRINPDMSHSEMVASTYEAIRLGAEAASGVPELLEALEDAWVSRDPGNHTTPEDTWEYKFNEALSSGVKKYGAAIQLRQDLPEYDPNAVPAGVPDRLLVGEPGDKSTFTDLLRELQNVTDDDLYVTSVLWNSPRTRDLAREWGLEFVNQRVLAARTKPEPIRENPTIPEPVAPDVTKTEPSTLVAFSEHAEVLTNAECEYVKSRRTFIDDYLAASALKGFSVPAYDTPGAWTALSMVMGPRAITAYNGVGVNLWFIEMGGTGSGKTTSQTFLKGVLNSMLIDGEGYYNVGASSSPAAIHEELLVRDGKASMVHHDEAASFFSDLHNTEWMKTLEHHFSAFYDGDVEPSNKVRLPKELRGKHARTSFNLNMSATPDKLLSLVTTGMFESGFLSRVNWTWAPSRPETDERFEMGPSEVDSKVRTHPAVYDLATDLLDAASHVPDDTVVQGTPEAWKRLSQAAKFFHQSIETDRQYDVLQGPLTRLRETTVKCAALIALYEGRTVFTEGDVLVALKYAGEWFTTTRRVVAEASESEFSRDAAHIESYVRANVSVSEAKILHQFKGLIKRTSRELTEKIDFLVSSGRLLLDTRDNKRMYSING